MSSDRETTGLRALSERERMGLVAEMLGFFSVPPGGSDAQGLRDLLAVERFAAYGRAQMLELVRSLALTGLLFRLPHLHGRSTRYITTRFGRELRARYVEWLEGENAPE